MKDLSKITFTKNTVTTLQVKDHLHKCDPMFLNDLYQKVDLDQYVTKIVLNAVTFEAWNEGQLTGLVAAYFNDKDSKVFITNVSVIKDHEGSGIGKQLIRNCIEYARKNKFAHIDLEVKKDNVPAISLYRKYNFIDIKEDAGSLYMRLIMAKD